MTVDVPTAITLVGVAIGVGKLIHSITVLTGEVRELRTSVSNLLRRVGDAEGDIKAILRGEAVERELSGRVRIPVPRGGDVG